MERMIDDSVKQKLLDSLAEESTMVISTAYAYAKNYVMYGEDITKAWTTAVQQASVIQEVRQKAWVEAYDSFKKEYENRLKADMVAMLTEIQLEIEEMAPTYHNQDWSITDLVSISEVNKVIQQKINALKGEEE
jgi:hypothetical protein